MRKKITLATLILAAFSTVPAFAEEPSVGDTFINLAYSIDTFHLLMSGALVMWIAAGFAMLEAGLVRGKDNVEILTKNVGPYSIACIMYMFVHGVVGTWGLLAVAYTNPEGSTGCTAYRYRGHLCLGIRHKSCHMGHYQGGKRKRR